MKAYNQKQLTAITLSLFVLFLLVLGIVLVYRSKEDVNPPVAEQTNQIEVPQIVKMHELEEIHREINLISETDFTYSQLETINGNEGYVSKARIDEPMSDFMTRATKELKEKGWKTSTIEAQSDMKAKWFTATKNDLILNINTKFLDKSSTSVIMEVYKDNQKVLGISDSIQNTKDSYLDVD